MYPSVEYVNRVEDEGFNVSQETGGREKLILYDHFELSESALDRENRREFSRNECLIHIIRNDFSGQVKVLSFHRASWLGSGPARHGSARPLSPRRAEYRR